MAPLNPEESIIVENVLIDDEGKRNFAYLDCCGFYWRKCTCETKGYLTIGIGRNLDTVGISNTEMLALNANDVRRVTRELESNFSWFPELNTARRVVILSMAFNLGISGLKKFKNMIKAIEVGDFDQASNEMKQSTWSKQVKSRENKLSKIMRSGQL